jgi:hypothetical protein
LIDLKNSLVILTNRTMEDRKMKKKNHFSFN